MSKLAVYAIVICQSMLMALASESIAQRKYLAEIEVELVFDNSKGTVELKSLIEEIESISKFRFAYTRRDVKGKNITITSGKWNLRDLLKEVSVQGRFSISRINESIALIPVKDRKLPDIAEKVVASTTVRGNVTDENGQPLPGATVMEKGTTNGTVTDLDGNYRLTVDEGAVLVVSFVGYHAQEVAVNSRVTVNISLDPDLKALEEVVVVGYGTLKKSDLTGAVASLKQDNAEELPVTSVDQLLQGRIAGVQVIQNSGSPGSGLTFNIRGSNSLGSNQPLIVIDGYPVQASSGGMSSGADPQIGTQPSYNPLANINPNDIASIEVLKDASSTAIYGSRGANGVVIITTKRGREGKNEVSFNVRTDISHLRKKIDVLNAEDFIAFSNEAARNDGLDSVFNATRIAQLEGVNYDWQDETYRMAISNDYQLSVRGGSKQGKYAVIANYLKQEGIIRNSDFERGGIRLNYDSKVSDLFEFGVNIGATKTKGRLALHSSRIGQQSTNVVTTALLSDPTRQATDDFGGIDQSLVNNPLALLELKQDVTENTFLRASMTGTLNFTEWLSLETNIGANENSGIRQVYMPRGTFLGDQVGGYAYRNESTVSNFLVESYLRANKNLGNGTLNAILGSSWQQSSRRVFSTSASQFPNDLLTFESMQSGNAPGIPQTLHRDWYLASYYGRFNYSVLDRYLVTFTARADGSSRLSDGYRWDFFPSGAVGWRIHEEPFFTLDRVNNLKLRASYGITGNQAVPPLSTKAFFRNNRTVIGGDIINGYVLSNLPNETLGWEKTSQFNIGTDIGLYENRIKIVANYYIKTTDNLLVDISIPATTGFSQKVANAGSVENRGFELDIKGVPVENEVTWNAGVNFSFNRNRILSLGEYDESGDVFGPNYLTAGGILGQPVHIVRVGGPIGAFYGYKIDGIYQNDEEVAAGPQSGTAQPGDFKFVDINGDSTINGDDRTIIGNPYPDFIFGITNDISYKGFNLYFFIQGVVGNDILNLNRYRLDALSNDINVSQEAYDGRWTGEGTSNKYPRASTSSYFDNKVADFLVEDGSYIRLKNIILSYNFDKWLEEWKWIKSAKVFVSATNLLTFTNYSGYDPDVNANADSGLTPGIDNGVYPQPKTYSVGINLTF